MGVERQLPRHRLDRPERGHRPDRRVRLEDAPPEVGRGRAGLVERRQVLELSVAVEHLGNVPLDRPDLGAHEAQAPGGPEDARRPWRHRLEAPDRVGPAAPEEHPQDRGPCQLLDEQRGHCGLNTRTTVPLPIFGMASSKAGASTCRRPSPSKIAR